MQLTRLKLTGFKTFVEPTEFLIEPGLTGIVGPNGCGKSNLVEALRWVMGESSFKNMRGSGMEDVIFAGSNDRPGRNMAEVALTLDNSSRKAPAAFNETDVLEVTRRIEREEGSTYRVNGKEVRARDVQLLFADAATGARSPALVRQGQISEIISAKPQSRRRILEDAAGIAGLHSRRHEAELRLRGAEDNLTRLEDVLGEIDGQIEALQRQARQAARYRSLAADIRRAEAILALIARHEARLQEAQAQQALDAAARLVADKTGLQAAAAREQAVAAHQLPALREAEASAAAGLVRLRRGLDELEAENRRATQRAEELGRRLIELQGDLARQESVAGDASQSLARLAEEEAALTRDSSSAGGAEAAARTAQASTESLLATAEAAYASAQAALSDLAAKRAALERSLREARDRLGRARTEGERLEKERAALEAAAPAAPLEALRQTLAEAQQGVTAADAAAAKARTALATARQQEAQARGPLNEAERRAQGLETEIRTLEKLLAPAAGDRFPAIVEAVEVARGYEVALGAALGDDLDAALDAAAPTHWLDTGEGHPDPALPDGAAPLAAHIKGPPALSRRLAQIGVVQRADGPRLRTLLQPGQRLVSREGDIWRWDGFTGAAEAPSPAARRLAEKNRLGELRDAAAQARAEAEAARAVLDTAAGEVKLAAQAEAAALEAIRQGRRQLDQARDQMLAAERREAERAARRAALDDGLARAARMIKEAQAEVAAQEQSLSQPAAGYDAGDGLAGSAGDAGGTTRRSGRSPRRSPDPGARGRAADAAARRDHPGDRRLDRPRRNRRPDGGGNAAADPGGHRRAGGACSPRPIPSWSNAAG